LRFVFLPRRPAAGCLTNPRAKQNRPHSTPGAAILSTMTAEDALRFVVHEAEFCREHDAHEALCLLLPALSRCLQLRPMTGNEARRFRQELRDMLETDFRFDPKPVQLGGWH
jgi:hypothetical protein